MTSVNYNTLINTHPLVPLYIYNRLQYVTCSSDTYRQNGGFRIHKTGAHRACLGFVKMTSDIVYRRTFVFKSIICMILQSTRSFIGS